jgi:predicted transposase/invertase (TIGR01784 family)
VRDSDGKRFNVEVQGDDSGASCKRARYHSSMVDVNMLKKGKKFEKLRDSYVIFITKNDYFESGQPIYHVERMVCETRAQFGDGSHIVYVNGRYKGNDAIGKLIHDFWCKNPDDMNYSQLAEGVRYYKEVEGGREKMCEAVEKYAEEMARIAVEKYAEEKAEVLTEKIQEKQADMVRNLMKNMSFTIEQAFEALNVPEADRKVISEKI